MPLHPRAPTRGAPTSTGTHEGCPYVLDRGWRRRHNLLLAGHRLLLVGGSLYFGHPVLQQDQVTLGAGILRIELQHPAECGGRAIVPPRIEQADRQPAVQADVPLGLGQGLVGADQRRPLAVDEAVIEALSLRVQNGLQCDSLE